MANYLMRNLFSQIQKRFLQSSATVSPILPLPTAGTCSSSFTVQFLVNSCGIPLQSAVSISKKFQLDEKSQRNAHSVLQLLKSHHFNDTLLAALIVKDPKILRCRVESNLQPKFEYLVENGFEGQLLPQIILSNPDIAFRSLGYQIKTSFELLRSVIDSNEKVLTFIKRTPWVLTSNLKSALQPNIDFLLKEGVPPNRVGKFLILQPRCILLKDRIAHLTNSVRNLGFEPTDPMFIYALRVMTKMNDSSWKKKIEIIKSMGFNEMEILKAFRRCPHVLSFSEECLRRKMDFYLNTIKFEPRSLIASPVLFTLSIEKRVRPRYNVLMILESKKLIKDIKKGSLFAIGEKNFRERYVDQFIDEVPGLLEAYLGTKEVEKIGA